MLHVLPHKDIKEHTEDSTCACRPMIELINGSLLVIHNSFDHREVVEQARKIINEEEDE